MAAPMLSGVAALLFSRYPLASAAQVKQAIVPSTCGGIVNAAVALGELGEILGAA